jgi:DNA-binding CsgD family transcriptional regulator
MLIRPLTNYNNLSFKAIKLNDSEQKKSDNLMQSLKVAPEQKSDTIKFQLYELYDKHLQKEVDLKCKSYHIKEDFAQEMFLKFFESLENVRKNILPIEEFIPFMNKVKPSKNEIKSGITETSIDQNIGSTELVLKDRLVDDDLPQYLSKKNEEERKIVQDEFDKVINKSTLKNIESKILKEKSTGKILQNIADELKLSKTTVSRYYYSAIYKIQDENNALPKNFENFVSEFAKTYEIKDSSLIKKAITTNPFILSAGIEKISKNRK